MRRSRRLRRPVWGLVALGVLLIPALAAGAAPGAGRASPVQGNDTRFSGPAATSYEERSDVAWSPAANRYLVVWSDGRGDTTRGEDIYARLVGVDGQPIGGEKLISGPSALGDDRCPAVAWGATSGQYLVIWQDGRNASWDIYGRRVGADGKPFGADFKISSSVFNDMCGDVAWGGTTNQFLAVWEDYRNTGSKGAEIYGRRVAANGTLAGTADFVVTGPAATADELAPAVAWGGTNNQFLVVWQDHRDYAARGADVYGARVTAAGVPTGGDIRISGSGATANDYGPVVAWNAIDNQFLVAWEDWRRLPGRGIDVYGQRVKANGALAGGEKRISGNNATSDEQAPAVAWSAASGQFLIAWQDWRNYPAPRYADIYGRLMTDAGTFGGNDFRVTGSKALMNEYDPAIAYNAAAYQFLVVWTDARSYSSRSFDIYGRRVAG